MEISINKAVTAVIDYFVNNEYFKSLLKVGWIYIIYCALHYCIPHIYTHLCVPMTIIGVLMSPFISQAPHCVALRWLLYNLGDNIKTMFMLLAGWFTNLLFANHT